jgi:hypothetical protein
MTCRNLCREDRLERVLAGLVSVGAAWLTWPASIKSGSETVSLVFLAIGIVAFLTGVVGWCPAYALFGVSTNKRTGA